MERSVQKARTGRHLSDAFPAENDLKQGDALSSLLFKLASEYAIRILQENKMLIMLTD
jgi:hypothetical protein